MDTANERAEEPDVEPVEPARVTRLVLDSPSLIYRAFFALAILTNPHSNCVPDLGRRKADT